MTTVVQGDVRLFSLFCKFVILQNHGIVAIATLLKESSFPLGENFVFIGNSRVVQGDILELFFLFFVMLQNHGHHQYYRTKQLVLPAKTDRTTP